MKFRTVFFLIGVLIFVSCSKDNSTPDPSINEIQPESGPPGTIVEIMGHGFSNDISTVNVNFNETEAEISTVSESEIQAIVPEEAQSGPISVTVDEITTTGPNFTVEAKAPVIHSIEPESGTVGTEVLLTGMNFSTIRSENIITFNGTLAPVNGYSETELRTVVPEDATDGPVEVTVGEKTAVGPEFDVIEVEPLKNKIVYGRDDITSLQQLYQIDIDGNNEQMIGEMEYSYDIVPTISPDGKKIVYHTRNNYYDPRKIFVVDSNGENPEEIFSEGVERNHNQISWSPDGLRIAFVSEKDGNEEIYTINIDGSDLKRLTNSNREDGSPSWSPDGSTLLFFSNRNDFNEPSIFSMNSDGSEIKQITSDDYADYDPVWSPDGSKIAYLSYRDSNMDIFTMDSDGSNITRITTTDQDESSISWSPDGLYLAFERDDDLFKILSDGTGNEIQLAEDKSNLNGPHWSPVEE